MPDQIPYDTVGYFAIAIAILVLAAAIAESFMRRLPRTRARTCEQSNDN